MTKKEFFELGLPKWPALAVVGKAVTQEQAFEILIRTDYLYFSSNDREFDKQLNEAMFDVQIENAVHDSLRDAICKKLGLDPKGNVWNEVDDYKRPFLESVKKLDLEYLHNSQIVSSWIGGPHGWCDWNGNIGCRNYNIGKYPSVEDIYTEWQQIAQAFPFLELTCQLMSHEAGPEDGVDRPVVEYRIRNGRVVMAKPVAPITSTAFGSADMFARFNNPFAERGCSIELFKKALEHTRNKMSDPQTLKA